MILLVQTCAFTVASEDMLLSSRKKEVRKKGTSEGRRPSDVRTGGMGCSVRPRNKLILIRIWMQTPDLHNNFSQFPGWKTHFGKRSVADVSSLVPS
jgi:hypothetical protein